MCCSCGCEHWNQKHKDSRNITRDDLQDAADAAGISIYEVIENINEAKI